MELVFYAKPDREIIWIAVEPDGRRSSFWTPRPGFAALQRRFFNWVGRVYIRKTKESVNEKCETTCCTCEFSRTKSILLLLFCLLLPHLSLQSRIRELNLWRHPPWIVLLLPVLTFPLLSLPTTKVGLLWLPSLDDSRRRLFPRSDLRSREWVTSWT